jgi:hypothetical protein
MSPKVLGEIEVGDTVTIHDRNGKLIDAGTCSRKINTRVRISHEISSLRRDYMIKSGKCIGRDQWARAATRKQYTEAVADLKRREAAKQAEADRDRKAAYDALPESIKLARELMGICDWQSEESLAGAPIEHLRGIVEWARANKLRT